MRTYRAADRDTEELFHSLHACAPIQLLTLPSCCHQQGLSSPSPAQRLWTGSRTGHNPLSQPRLLEQQQQQRGVVCQGLFGLGLPEIAVIAGVTALIFGPSKLPELGKGLGKTVKSFQTAAKEFKTELEQAASEEGDGDGDAAAAAAAAKDAAAKEAAANKKE